MSDFPFHRTPMGQHYYERQVPSLLAELRRLNENLERIARALEPLPANPAASDERPKEVMSP